MLLINSNLGGIPFGRCGLLLRVTRTSHAYSTSRRILIFDRSLLNRHVTLRSIGLGRTFWYVDDFDIVRPLDHLCECWHGYQRQRHEY